MTRYNLASTFASFIPNHWQIKAHGGFCSKTWHLNQPNAKKLQKPPTDSLKKHFQEFTNIRFALAGVTDQELQALLSQKDIATSFAENLLKQFETDDLDVKPQINNNSKMLCEDTTPPPMTIKTEPSSTEVSQTVRQRLDMKMEPVIKIEKIDECDKKPKFSLNMTSKEILANIK
jgi:hypothetical protein